MKDKAEEANRIINQLFGMCLERDAFKTEWGASPRAQGTVKLLQEISQIRAEVISLHTPETDVRAREMPRVHECPWIYLCLHFGRAVSAQLFFMCRQAETSGKRGKTSGKITNKTEMKIAISDI